PHAALFGLFGRGFGEFIQPRAQIQELLLQPEAKVPQEITRLLGERPSPTGVTLLFEHGYLSSSSGTALTMPSRIHCGRLSGKISPSSVSPPCSAGTTAAPSRAKLRTVSGSICPWLPCGKVQRQTHSS